MKLKRLIFFLFFTLTNLGVISLVAQEVDSARMQPAVEKPMGPRFPLKKQKQHVNHDLRIGIDLSTIIIGAIAPYRSGLDLSVEYNVKPKLFVLLEGGYNYYKKENIRIKYISQGNYIRAGFDYNLRKSKEINDYDIYYIGFRYGFSKFQQEVPEYLLVNDYWGNSTDEMSPEDGYAHWVELLTGFKVEVLKNWFLGMGVRFKFFVKRSKTNIEPVQFVPGYARNYNSGVMDFNYTVYYNLPLNYKKKKIGVYEK